MLQWNHRFVALVAFAVALASLFGFGGCLDILHISW
jgi:hypothetical protein